MIANTKVLHQTYDNIADGYSNGIAIINAFHSKFYLRNAPSRKDSVLDIGCGTGDILANISSSFVYSYGIDPIKRFIAIAKKKAAHSTFYIGSAEALPFEDQSMDYVISHVVFQHIDRNRVIKEAIRVLKPGGRLIISEALSKDIPQQASAFNLYRLRFNWYLLARFGIKRAQQIKVYRTSSDWKKLSSIHKTRRFDFTQLQAFYSKKLPQASFKRLEPKIIAIVWDKPKIV